MRQCQYPQCRNLAPRVPNSTTTGAISILLSCQKSPCHLRPISGRLGSRLHALPPPHALPLSSPPCHHSPPDNATFTRAPRDQQHARSTTSSFTPFQQRVVEPARLTRVFSDERGWLHYKAYYVAAIDWAASAAMRSMRGLRAQGVREITVLRAMAQRTD
ncbi:hypothetical protein BJ546DRAFT_123068 [Cryomyces antarcticus]